MQSFIINSHAVFIHIHQGCFAGTGAIVRLPQCQWSKPDGYGKISQCITTTKHIKAKPCAYFLGYTVCYTCAKFLLYVWLTPCYSFRGESCYKMWLYALLRLNRCAAPYSGKILLLCQYRKYEKYCCNNYFINGYLSVSKWEIFLINYNGEFNDCKVTVIIFVRH